MPRASNRHVPIAWKKVVALGKKWSWLEKNGFHVNTTCALSLRSQTEQSVRRLALTTAAGNKESIINKYYILRSNVKLFKLTASLLSSLAIYNGSSMACTLSLLRSDDKMGRSRLRKGYCGTRVGSWPPSWKGT